MMPSNAAAPTPEFKTSDVDCDAAAKKTSSEQEQEVCEIMHEDAVVDAPARRVGRPARKRKPPTDHHGYYGVEAISRMLRMSQVGCELEEKERFWSELDEVMESIPTGERVVIGVDFNGHVGEGNTGDEEVMGKFGVKERNL
ncbi:hypothetical protein QTP70_027707 [Hemibagrus guttatus]|uniref:Uncharacterized protein n=1 Tax=Hemibagrus guttatus TaxID=175788 RepID=A0AAE0PRF0_9TELE|nr:hypothetical protein QTP70_027707 [Hemibagrus guttatus]